MRACFLILHSSWIVTLQAATNFWELSIWRVSEGNPEFPVLRSVNVSHRKEVWFESVAALTLGYPR